MDEKQYDVIQNGGIMYRVFDNGTSLRIIHPISNLTNNTEIDPDMEGWNFALGMKKSEIRISYKRLWIAHDPENYVEDGFQIVAEIECYEDVCMYMYIGGNITFFWASPQIQIYRSYMGNSAVPYGFVANNEYVYGLWGEEIKAASRARIEKLLKKSLSDNLSNDDLYDITSFLFEVPSVTVKQEILHNAYGEDEYTPFHQKALHRILREAKQLGKRKQNAIETTIGLQSVLPKNIVHEIASFRTGLYPRTNKLSVKNTLDISPVTGSLSNNFHMNRINNSIIQDSNIPHIPAINPIPNVTTTRCKGSKCAIMGGTRKHYKRHLKKSISYKNRSRKNWLK